MAELKYTIHICDMMTMGKERGVNFQIDIQIDKMPGYAARTHYSFIIPHSMIEQRIRISPVADPKKLCHRS